MQREIYCSGSAHTGKLEVLATSDWPKDTDPETIARSHAGYLCEACAATAAPTEVAPTLDERIAAIEVALAGTKADA